MLLSQTVDEPLKEALADDDIVAEDTDEGKGPQKIPVFLRGVRKCRAGGLEGGMTTGMPLIITAAMKPLPTLAQPLDSVDMETLEPCKAHVGRSDVCAVPAAAVVAEAEVAFVLATAYTEKFGCDNMADIQASIKAYNNRLRTVSR